MILRRFIQHVYEQNWVAVLIDIIVVFGSVLLATQISVAIESKRNNDQLKVAMKRVSGELNASAENMDWMADGYRKRLTALREVLVILDGGSEINLDPTVRSRAFLALFQPSRLALQYDLISELQSSVGLRSIPYDDLHDALRELKGYFSSVEDTNKLMSTPERGIGLVDFPFIRTELVLEDDNKGWGSMVISDVDWSQARRSSAFRNLVVLTHHNMGNLLVDLEIAKAMGKETARLMEVYGFSAGITWYEETGEELERSVTSDVQKLLIKGVKAL